MKIRIVGSSVGRGEPQQFLLSYLFNDTVAIDAGSIGFMTPIADQTRIQHVFLSHTHMDHTASLPSFLDNVFEPGPRCPTIYGHRATLHSLQVDFFNDRIWPDLVRLSAAATPFFQLKELTNERSVSVESLKVTPIEVDHIVPTFSFLVESADSAVAVISDTGPSDRIWEVLNATPRLKAIFLEVSFPDNMDWLADKAKHLTPRLFRIELQKLKHDVDVIAVHIKPSYREAIEQELSALGLPRLQIGVPETVYEY